MPSTSALPCRRTPVPGRRPCSVRFGARFSSHPLTVFPVYSVHTLSGSPAGFRFSVRSIPPQAPFAVPLHGEADARSALLSAQEPDYSHYTRSGLVRQEQTSSGLCTKSALILEIGLASQTKHVIIIMYSYAGTPHRHNEEDSAMKKSAKTAMTAAVFAAALGISAGGTVPADAASYLAATDQRTMQILYGPGPDFVPPPDGDANGDKLLDARDLTLIKQRLLSLKYGELAHIYGGDFDFIFSAYLDDYDAYYDRVLNDTDARYLARLLTGETSRYMDPEEQARPLAFKVYLQPVAYLSDNVPESAEDRAALEEAAAKLLRALRSYNACLMDPAAIQPVLSNRAIFDLWLNRPSELLIPDGFQPQNSGVEEDGARYLPVECRFGFWAPGDPVPTGEFTDDGEPIYAASNDDDWITDSTLKFRVCAFRSDPDAGGIYYDKCVVEWDVNTGKILVHDSLTKEQALPEFGNN